MQILFAPTFYNNLKKLDVRIRKRIKANICHFHKNPDYPPLRKHKLSGVYRDFLSINITQDYRALFCEIDLGDEKLYYFVSTGTHKELYRNM